MLHRPGLALGRLTPSNREALLFDEVVWVKPARIEHLAFSDLLREHGVEVVFLRRPRECSYMHLDSVFTQCDVDLVNMFPGVVDAIRCFSQRPADVPGQPPDVRGEAGNLVDVVEGAARARQGKAPHRDHRRRRLFARARAVG